MNEKNGVRAQAAKFAGIIRSMSEAEREELAAKMGTVVNPAGHALTFRNAALLTLQSGRYDLTMVAGFRQWVKAGRIVLKGQHSVGCIMVPMTGKKTEDGEEGKVFFRYVPVFDVTQTEEIQTEEIKPQTAEEQGFKVEFLH